MRLDSWEQARSTVPAILERINADPALALAAAANPLLALGELGYEIAPGLEAEFSDRLRFGPKVHEERSRLRDEIFKIAGHPFDVDNAGDLHRVVFEELKVRPLTPGDEVPLPGQLELPLAPRSSPGKVRPDPLQPFRSVHPIVPLLIRYREIDGSQARLASPGLYASIRSGGSNLPVTRLTARLHRPVSRRK